MQGLDTNVLVYAVMTTPREHARARRILADLAEGSHPWALPWPCVYEFLRVVTHPRVFHPPMPPADALRDLRQVLSSPSVVLLSETERHAEILQRVVADSGASGNLLHDAHIAALCLEHGVSEIITGDRDFRRFRGLTAINPFD